MPITIAVHSTVFALIALISFRLFPAMYPLRVDLPNHLARHAIQCGGPLGEFYSTYYTFTMRAVPNLAADLVYSFDIACKDIFLTSRLITQFSILNFVAALYLLHFVIWRKVSLWPFAAILLVYNRPFSYGFENYVLSVPFVFYLFSLWLYLSEKRSLLRVSVVAPLAFGLYFLHIIAFGFFILLVAGWELGRIANLVKNSDFQWPKVVMRTAATLLLALPAGLHFVFALNTAGHEKGETIFGFRQRADALLSIVMPGGQGTLDTPGGLGLLETHILLPLIVFIFILALFSHGMKSGLLQVNQQMKAALWLVFISALLTPALLSGVALIHIRYPFMVLGTLIAASSWNISKQAQIVLTVSLLAIFSLRTEALRQEWQAGGTQVEELIAATAKLPDGSGILLTRTRSSYTITRHSHTLAYAGLFNNILVPTLFNGTNPLTLSDKNLALFGTQYFPYPITVLFHFMKEGAPDSSSESDVLNRKRLAKLSYFLVLGTVPPDPASYPDGVELFHQGSYFTILKSDITRWGG